MAACGWGVRAKVKHVVSKFPSAPREFNPCEWNLSELLLVGISCTELVCRLYDRPTVCSHHRAIRILLTTIPPLGRSAEYCDQSACESRYDTIRDAILTCAQKPTWIGLIYRTETTTKNCKTQKLKSKSRYVRSNSKSLGNHVVHSEKRKRKAAVGRICRKRF